MHAEEVNGLLDCFLTIFTLHNLGIDRCAIKVHDVPSWLPRDLLEVARKPRLADLLLTEQQGACLCRQIIMRLFFVLLVIWRDPLYQFRQVTMQRLKQRQLGLRSNPTGIIV